MDSREFVVAAYRDALALLTAAITGVPIDDRLAMFREMTAETGDPHEAALFIADALACCYRDALGSGALERVQARAEVLERDVAPAMLSRRRR
ncbi:hypothetical protein RBS60_13055 [Sinomonas sp. ASV486]|uniref:hypothetical protein n=1 Tax=Sinomonas sp. ASV486 TaxID=3051170 RepID=UPI0027DBD305|nr:hypothetical protein [Sinomonas sp. ASV486]MDQ4491125.1 hypothetical protein [Sinomonas sp. ASV486]